MDIGVLGIAAAKAGEGDDFLQFFEAWWKGESNSPRGWLQWQAREFEVRSREQIVIVSSTCGIGVPGAGCQQVSEVGQDFGHHVLQVSVAVKKSAPA
jgi:hypothetical protein